MALGEQIEESRGKITSERVLEVGEPKVEVSFTMGETIGEFNARISGLIHQCYEKEECYLVRDKE